MISSRMSCNFFQRCFSIMDFIQWISHWCKSYIKLCNQLNYRPILNNTKIYKCDFNLLCIHRNKKTRLTQGQTDRLYTSSGQFIDKHKIVWGGLLSWKPQPVSYAVTKQSQPVIFATCLKCWEQQAIITIMFRLW